MYRLIIYTLIICLTAAPALAKCPYRNKASAHYQTGAKHYNAKEYSKAVEAFVKAQKLCPTVSMIYNIARVHDLAGDTETALMLYQQYLKLKDPKANPMDIKKRIKELRTAAAFSWTDPFKPEENAPVKQKPLDCPTKASSQKPQEPRWKRLWAWVATGAGVALLGTGTALLAIRRDNEWRRNEDTGKLESVTDSVVPGAVLAGAGALAAGLGVWLFVKEDGQEQEARVTLRFVPTGTGVSLGGFF